MIRRGFAVEVPFVAIQGVLLSPTGESELTMDDRHMAAVNGLHLIDGPWELLEIHALMYRERGGVVRRLPASLEPANEYYRRHNPRYFYSSYRFSTVEATAYALALVGHDDCGRTLAQTFEFEGAYLASFLFAK